MQADVRDVVLPKIEHGFEESRMRVHEMLSQLSFVRVMVISSPSAGHFQGEVSEIVRGKTGRSAFFSKYGRQNGRGFELLGFTLVDSPLGNAHSSATPQIGDIMLGTLSSTKKGKLPWELRGWCNNAKPLMELHRIVQFGSKMGEAEMRRIFKQQASITAGALLRLSSASLLQNEKDHAQFAVKAADDVFALLRIVCFGKLDLSDLTLSKNYVELIDSVATRFGDEKLLDAWALVRPAEYIPAQAPQGPQAPQGSYQHAHVHPQNASNYGWGAQANAQAYAQAYAPSASTYVWSAKEVLTAATSEYSPDSPQRPKTPTHAVEYVPGSPPYRPSDSPPYAPASPLAPPSPLEAPLEKPLTPPSPLAPPSPPYRPMSPVPDDSDGAIPEPEPSPAHDPYALPKFVGAKRIRKEPKEPNEPKEPKDLKEKVSKKKQEPKDPKEPKEQKQASPKRRKHITKSPLPY